MITCSITQDYNTEVFLVSFDNFKIVVPRSSVVNSNDSRI